MLEPKSCQQGLDLISGLSVVSEVGEEGDIMETVTTKMRYEWCG